MGRLGNGPSLQWAEFAMGRDVQLPSNAGAGYTFYPLSLPCNTVPTQCQCEFTRRVPASGSALETVIYL